VNARFHWPSLPEFRYPAMACINKKAQGCDGCGQEVKTEERRGGP
jgi:hypothetical protein